jgi:hypothetical protein
MQDIPDHMLCASIRIVGGANVDISRWATPDEGALVGEQRALYFARKAAVTLYLQGSQAEEIKQKTGLGEKQAYRLIRERCLETHADGQPYGWRALIPYVHIQPYKRRTKILIDSFGNGGAGAMETLLDTYPDVRTAFEQRIRTIPSGKKLTETKVSIGRHCTWFLDELRRRGCEHRNEWPFNTASTAYYSVRRYVAKVLSGDPVALAWVTGGPEMTRKLKTGEGTDRPVTNFLQRVEMDAHKLDGRFCVSIPEIGGGIKERIVYRLWVISMIDVVSRIVIGYYFSTAKEVSSDDVLRCIKSALTKWQPQSITFSKEPYREGAGLLSSLGEEFVGLCWDETSVDGALAETCERVKGALKDAVGSVLLTPDNSFAKRRSLDDRPFIEAFFRNLAGKGFQRLSNTTGAKAEQKKGRDPEGIAVTSRFQYEYAEELLDVLIANYNATPHRGIGNRTPLAYAKFLFQNGQREWRRSDAVAVESLLSVRKLCRVRGGAKVGRGVYVECEYARYTNEILQNRQDLVGELIWVIHHKENDARIALASTQEGTSLGVLRAAPPWHILPHSLSMRRAIMQAQSIGKFHIPPGGDAIATFINYVESQPRNKLPVHPTYLAARRILAQAADQFVSDALLQAAQERAVTTSTAGVAASAEVDRSSTQGVAGSKQSTMAVPRKVSLVGGSLPARRIAATRPSS